MSQKRANRLELDVIALACRSFIYTFFIYTQTKSPLKLSKGVKGYEVEGAGVVDACANMYQ